MKSRILSTVAVVTLIMFAILLFGAMFAYPMHIGEPTWYHTARVECLTPAAICALVAFVSAMASVLF